MNNWIDPTVKHEWNIVMLELHNFFFSFFKHNTLRHLGLYEPSSPFSKELHDYDVITPKKLNISNSNLKVSNLKLKVLIMPMYTLMHH